MILSTIDIPLNSPLLLTVTLGKLRALSHSITVFNVCLARMVSDDGHQHGPSSAAQQEKQTQLTVNVKRPIRNCPSICHGD
ncbi:hypothetical protein T07_2513 [Trichinella nelsoni]|uniref:Uncharacterized protein n=1 Tax=Trichinella nelsoni TaxID=6336 RepID=A0A0V0S9Y7_9BILA|nr:hypothetical protein T07_2513 [Trichinella nelsoni]